jgi:hypothetical protein
VLSSWLLSCCSRVCSHLADCPRGGADCPRGAFWPKCSSCSSCFLSAFISIRLASGFGGKMFGGPSARTSRTVRAARVARRPSEDVVRTVRLLRCRLGRSVRV